MTDVKWAASGRADTMNVQFVGGVRRECQFHERQEEELEGNPRVRVCSIIVSVPIGVVRRALNEQ